MKQRAWVYIRKFHPYPGLETKLGLKACGFDVRSKYEQHLKNSQVLPYDLLVTWTLWREKRRTYCANMHRKLGGIVICAENGWLRNTLPQPYYQFAFRNGSGSGVNGQGTFPIGDASRWKSWNLKLKEWRRTGDYILVRPQRGLKPDDPEIAHGPNWPDEIIAKIRKYSDRPIWWRPHPGNKRPCLPKHHKIDKLLDPHETSLQDQLSRAWCMVVYSSSEASEALINGVPVCYDGMSITCQEGAGRIKEIENPPMVDREALFSKLAWNMWNLKELETGAAFKHMFGMG